MQIDQVGTPAGEAGFARDDGLATGATVTLKSLAHKSTFRFRFKWVGLTPNPDTTSVASLVQFGADSYTFSPTAAVYGSWLIELITDEGTANEDRNTKVWAVVQPGGIRIPAPNEKGDPEAAIFRNGPQQIVRTDFNKKEASGPWMLGRTVSWWRELSFLIYRYSTGPGPLLFTPIKVAGYAAQWSEHVRANGAFTITLPPAAERPNGKIGVISLSGSNVVLDPNAAETINGASTYTIATSGKSVVLQSDGVSDWKIVAYYPGGGV